MTPKAANLTDLRREADWIRHHERGSNALLRIMAFVSLRLGRTLSRIPLYGIAIYFFLLAPAARRHSLRYLRLALGRTPRARDRFRQILTFATTIHDRVYLINGQFETFNITVEGEAWVLAQSESGRGAMLMGAHMGSFEVMHSLGRRRRGIKVAMAMYEENARKINATLAAINPRLVSDIIPLGRIDSMLNIAERLDGAAIRVPTPNVSVVDFKFVARRKTTADEIKDTVKRASQQQLKGILTFTESPNVSADFNHDPHSSIFHMDQTRVMEGTFVRVLAWYDNEWGFSNRMIDVAAAMGKLL